MIENPKIIVDKKIHDKVMYWVNKCPVECSGFGTAIYNKELGGYEILSAMMLPNTGSAAETDIKAEDINAALFKLVNEKGVMRWWWHSHVNMGVFWSATDDAAMKLIGQGGFCLATVYNKRGENKSAYLNPNHEFPLFLNDLKYETTQENSVTAEWEKEYQENFKEKVWVQPVYATPNYGSYGNYQGHYDRDYNPKIDSLSKKERKKLRKEEKHSGHVLDMDYKYPDSFSSYDDVLHSQIDTPYPFTDIELESFAKDGIDQRELDDMIDMGWDRDAILNYYGFQYLIKENDYGISE